MSKVARLEELVAKPITQADIDAIPVANSSMSVDELREICVRFMRLMNSFPWVPDTDFPYKNKDKDVVLPRGGVVGGLPYISLSKGTLYNFMHFYDEKTGIVDVKKILSLKQPFMKVIANQCSGCAYWGWARVSNSLHYEYTTHMVEANGCIPIAPFKIPPEIYDFLGQQKDTRELCRENGEQVVYQSYANMLPGDGVNAHILKGGHVRMVSSKPVVVCNEDGTINGAASYVTLLEQKFRFDEKLQDNGILIAVEGGVDKIFSFRNLFKDGYYPFTIPEFAGKPVDKAEAGSDCTAAAVTVGDLEKTEIKANYPISYLTVAVKDPAGAELYKNYIYSCEHNVYAMPALSADALELSEIQAFADGKNTVEISALVGTGENLVAYRGTLC